MKKVRVATLLTELAIGGDENRVLHFARAFDRRRFELMIVTINAPTAADEARLGPIAHRYRDLGVELRSLRLTARRSVRPLPRPIALARDAARSAWTAARLAALLREERIDVLDARMNYNIVVGAAAARLAGRPLVATEYYDPFWSREPWKQLARPVFGQCAAFISDSGWVLEQYRRDLRWELPNGVVVQNGVEPPGATLDRAAIRARLGIPAGARVVGQVARLAPFKGQRVLLEAAARLPGIHVLICGYPGPHQAYRDELVARVRELSLGRRVTITGYPGPIGDVWNAVDVHAHPSLLDSSPISIHESMSLGLPLVASTIGGIPELVEDGVTGLLVPPGDVGALAAALRRVLDEPDLAARLGAAAKARHDERHRPERMARALEDILARAAVGARA